MRQGQLQMQKKIKECRICAHTDINFMYTAREMMFGTKEIFEYFKCNKCGCLQIADIPTNLSDHYPSNYYSLNSDVKHRDPKSNIRLFLEKCRVKLSIFNRGYKLAAFARNFVDIPINVHWLGKWLKLCKVKSFEASFLDVGCGTSSWWLNELEELGFNRLTGVDPNIESGVHGKNIKILKGSLEDLSGTFDVITLHHSLEHIPDQIKTLKQIRKLLKPNGVCLLRIPISSSTVWDEYKTDWVELDAPRHLYLHSYESVDLLTKQAGLIITHKECDSTEFEFWGSEQYRRGIPLMDDKSHFKTPSISPFTFAEMESFKQAAIVANRESKGGRCCFFLERTSQ